MARATARYVDGYLLPVPKKKLAAYKRMAKLGAAVWTSHGALQYCECVGEDLKVKFGMPFTKLLKLKATETAVFSWIAYKSRAHRDAVNAKAMKDPRLAKMMTRAMPFDVKRMGVGGFTVMVTA